MYLSESERNNIDLEDCLNLDVYSTNTNFIDLKTNNLVPVMVYVHGGSFRNYNSPDFQPHYLMKRNIILVVMNYRLDALGKYVRKIYHNMTNYLSFFFFQVSFQHYLRPYLEMPVFWM